MGARKDMAQWPSPTSIMTRGTLDGGTPGFPEQSTPEQGVRRVGGTSPRGGSADLSRFVGARVDGSAPPCVCKVTECPEQPALASDAGAQNSTQSERIAPSV
ncbi:hypothetical protein ACYOEI_01315 [Singulisphaera rosea]